MCCLQIVPRGLQVIKHQSPVAVFRRSLAAEQGGGRCREPLAIKVPHHGSRYQDVDWLRSLHPAAAVVSVGADNDYGHPDAELLDALSGDGVVVARTDQDGAVAVVAGEDGPDVVTSN